MSKEKDEFDLLLLYMACCVSRMYDDQFKDRRLSEEYDPNDALFDLIQNITEKIASRPTPE